MGRNGNKTWLNLRVGMGMNHWKWEGMGLKKTFPLISCTTCCKKVRQFTHDTYKHVAMRRSLSQTDVLSTDT